MAYDEHLATRIDRILEERKVEYLAKKMFGGLCYMINGKMTVGVVKSELMARVGVDRFQETLAREGVRDMDFTGRPMKGYVFVTPDALDKEADLEFFIDECLAFNKELTEG